MKTYWLSGSIAPRILDVGIRWRCRQIHALAALPHGNIPQYPLDRRLSGPIRVKSQIGFQLSKTWWWWWWWWWWCWRYGH